MESRSRFRPHFLGVEAIRDPGTKHERSCGWSFKPVAQARGEYEAQWQHRAKSCGVSRQEKLDGETMRRPYRKPTQVGEASSLR